MSEREDPYNPRDAHYSADFDSHLTVSDTTSNVPDIETIRKVSEDSITNSYGWCEVRPSFLQRFLVPKCLLFWLCLGAILQGMIVNGFVNVVITTIERRFGLHSTETGIIAGSYDIASVLCLIPVSYFGGTACKPLWIAWGIVILGLGSFIFAVPHFAIPVYTVTSVNQFLCQHDDDELQSKTKSAVCQSLGYLSNYKYVFILSQLLHGIGASPLYTLGVILLDDNFTTKMASVYIGVYYSMSIIGPAVGYVVGGQFLKLHTDFQRVAHDNKVLQSHDVNDINWVGAWWLGFLMAGCLSLVVAIPISGFPKELPGSRDIIAQKVLETDQRSLDKAIVTQMNFGISVKDIPKSLKILVNNPPFILLSFAGAFEALLLTGFATFLPKFAESQFGISASAAAFLMGSVIVIAGGGGTFLGGYLVTRFQLKCESIMKMCFIFACISLSSCCIFFVTCPNLRFAGLNEPYLNESFSSSLPDLNSCCHVGCNCSMAIYDPICGADNMMYYSPCYAGCTHSGLVGNELVFSNCSCIIADDKIPPKSSTANRAVCSNDCYYLPVFSCFLLVFGLFSFLASMPALSATLRCVPDQQKSFALGIQWIVIRCLGSIPSPIVFGALMDATCVFRYSGCVRQGSCILHNNSLMSRYFLITSITGKLVSTVLFLLAWQLYKPPNQDETGFVTPMSTMALENPGFVEDSSIRSPAPSSEAVATDAKF